MTAWEPTFARVVFIPCGSDWVRMDQIESFCDCGETTTVATLAGRIFIYPKPVKDFIDVLTRALSGDAS